MNAFGKFLLDYYIWILAVLGIVVVTIIGFLVDSKQKRKKRELDEQKLTNVDKTLESSTMVNNLENISVANTVNQTVPNVIDNGVENLPSNNYNLNTNNQTMMQNNENLSTQVNSFSNTTDVSLNAQKPHFEPGEVNIPTSQQSTNSNYYNQVAVPQQVNAVSITQPIQQPVYAQVTNPNVVNQHPYANELPKTQQLVPNSTSVNITDVKPVYQNVGNNQAQIETAKNITQPGYNNSLTNLAGNRQPINSNTQNSTIQTQPINNMNFVVGEQSINNSDDMWKL